MAEELPDQLHRVDVNLPEGLRRFTLRCKNTTRFEDAFAMVEKRAVEQPLRRAGGVGAIHQHHVVGGVLCLRCPGDAIPHMQVEAWITPAAATDGPRYLEPQSERAAAVAAGCEIWSPRWQRGAFDAVPAFVERELS